MREPSSTLHLIGVTCRLDDDLRPDRWISAVESVLAEEPLSHTRLTVIDGEVHQQLDESASTHGCRLVDLRTEPSEVATADLYIDRERHKPFDLFDLPLWRSFVVRERDGSYVAALLAPHIFADGPSFRLLFKRFDRQYRRLGENRNGLVEPERPPTFLSHAAAELAEFDTPEIQRFWSDMLSGVGSVGSSAGPTSGRSVEELSIGSVELEEIRRFCVARSWPFVMFLRAVYAVLIRRLTAATDDLVVLDVRDTRSPHQRKTVGCCFQTLPILVDAEHSRGSAPIDELVASLAANAERAEPWRNISSLTLGRLLPAGSLKCFFDFYLFETVDVLGRRRRLRSHLGYSDDEMHLVPSMTPDGISLKLDYPSGRFPGERFLERFVDVIGQVVAGRTRLDELDVLLPDEPRVIHSALPALPPRPVSAVSAVAEHVANRPDAIAVSCDGAQLSYGGLGARANRLAHHLRDRGVEPGAIVAIALDRTPELIVAILAVLETGATYLPLDPAGPSGRMRSVLSDSGASMLVTTSEIGDDRLGDLECPVTCLDREATAIGLCSDRPPDVHIDTSDAAYVIYTSGSTGEPKGVVVTHANLSALLVASRQTFDLSERDVWTMFHSVAFDFSVWEIFGALCSGGRLVVVPHSTTRSPQDFHELLLDEKVTVLSQTPSAFSALSGWEARLATRPELSLRYIVLGGEALRLDSLSGWMSRHGDTDPELVNMFGITETTVHVTHRRITRDDVEQAGSRSLIGGPLPGWILTLRNADGHPVPPGVVGEILVGGSGVALGYLNRPDLDAERFVVLDDQPDQRWYRSGDLARVDSHGDLEYLGRVDAQVKIRGFRIEPGEVEAALLADSSVDQAVVVALDHNGDQRLVAYLVAVPGTAPVEVDLHRRLSDRLPDYMLPWRILTLAELPMTANGKLDQRALPAPGGERPDGEQPFVPPATPIEIAVARIWEDVLDVGPIGVDDHFFVLGGNSLTATQMMLRVQDRFGTHLPLCTAFEHTTVAALAEVLHVAGASPEPAPPSAARDDEPPARPSGPSPLTFAQERAWFVQQLDPDNVAYHFVSTLTWHGHLDVGALEKALSELVRRHEVLRTTFPANDGRPHQVVHAPWPVHLVAEDASAAEVDSWARGESARPFDLDQLPLVRWKLLRLDSRRHVLVHIEHHLLHDGWSFALLLREMLALYESFSSGQPSLLPPARWQSADVALREREWIETDAAEDQLAFWTDSLADVPHVLELPTDRPRPAVQRFRGDAVRIRLDDQLSARLEAYSRRRSVTPNTTLRATFEALVGRLSGLERFVIGSGVASRRTPALESVVGMLLNNLALPADLSQAPDLNKSVSRVQETVVAALDHQDIPFDRVVTAIDPERSPGRSPLCQVFFSSYDGPLPSLELSDVRVEPMFGLNNGSAKFDLNVIVTAVPTKATHDAAQAGLSRPSRTLEMIWEYNTDLFTRETVQRWTDWYVGLLDSALLAPDRSMTTLPLMSTAEREQVVVSWNQTDREYPRDSTLPELFAGVALAVAGPAGADRR